MFRLQMVLSNVIVDVTISRRSFVFGQSIDWDSAACITYSTDCYQRLTLESWFTNLEQTQTNQTNNQRIIPSTDVTEDDYRTGCRNVSHCQQQQSYSGLRSPGRSNSTYF